MNDNPDTSGELRQRRQKEYEDPHFHDEDEVVPVDDVQPRGPNPPTRRKPNRRPPPRRYYEE
jgi:hypothetical protein